MKQIQLYNCLEVSNNIYLFLYIYYIQLFINKICNSTPPLPIILLRQKQLKTHFKVKSTTQHALNTSSMLRFLCCRCLCRCDGMLFVVVIVVPENENFVCSCVASRRRIVVVGFCSWCSLLRFVCCSLVALPKTFVCATLCVCVRWWWCVCVCVRL